MAKKLRMSESLAQKFLNKTSKSKSQKTSTKKCLSKKPTELEDQYKLVEYLAYKGVLFKFDYLAGARLSIGLAAKAKKAGNTKNYPDLFVAEPVGGKYGLFLELKREGLNIFKKNGEPTGEHYQEQLKMLARLAEKGYYACMVVGYHNARLILSSYLKGDFKVQEDFKLNEAVIF